MSKRQQYENSTAKHGETTSLNNKLRSFEVRDACRKLHPAPKNFVNMQSWFALTSENGISQCQVWRNSVNLFSTSETHEFELEILSKNNFFR